jgi:hypothetical protein
MTVTHPAPWTPGIHALFHRVGANAVLAVAVALFLAVLIVEAAIIVIGAPSAADLRSLYVITT